MLYMRRRKPKVSNVQENCVGWFGYLEIKQWQVVFDVNTDIGVYLKDYENFSVEVREIYGWG